jgi:hypothetical protein
MEGNTLTAFIAYFRELATLHVALAGSFVHGAAGRIISGTRTSIKYPCLWLETPTMVLTEKDGTVPDGRRSCAFAILKSVPLNDYNAQDLGWEETERLALDVISRMRRDRKARKFSFIINNAQLEPVATLTVDNEIGWRFEFELGNPVPVCYEPARWADTMEGGQG